MTSVTATRGLGSRRSQSIGRWLLSWLLWPVAFGGALWIAFTALEGARPPLAWWGMLWAASILVFPLEQALPFEREWRVTRRQFLTDVAHLITQALFGWLVVVVIYGISTQVVGRIEQPWPRHWPLAAQLVVALVVAEFFYYAYHRLAHQVDWLWRFHSVHHSSMRLNSWSATRHHPVDTVLYLGANVMPLVLLGATPVVLLLWYTAAAFQSRLQHCNVWLRNELVGLVFNTAEIHRIHHARDRTLCDSNYGGILVIWDWVFGTRRVQPSPTLLGVDAGSDYPQGFWAQLLEPFKTRSR